MKTPANYSHGPHTDADYGIRPRISLAPPPSVIYRRNQMRRTAMEVIMCVVMFVALVWFAATPDQIVVRAQVEAYQ